jgi:hypothetical protein
MKKKIKEKNNFKIDIYLVITLVILFLYTFWLLFFLSESKKEIKNIYLKIEKNQRDTLLLKSKLIKVMYEKDNLIFNLDLESDDSIYKYVTSNKSFNDLLYVPKNLELISSLFINDTK